MKNSHYIHYLSGFLISSLIMVGLFNYIVDPYSIFQSPRIDGFNTQKIGFTKYLRLTKARLIATRKPDTIILGTSRTGYGLSPNHPAFSDNNAFNLGIADMTMVEAVQYLHHANNINPLKKVIFAIDFRLFTNPHPNPSFSKSRLATNGTANFSYWRAWLDDYFSALFSYDALITSLRVIRYQTWEKINLLENGFWSRQSLNFNQYQAFRIYTTNTIKRINEFQQNNLTTKDTPKPLAEYRAFVQYCYQHKIELYLLISPSHAWHWETLRAIGAWEKFQYFKQQLLVINEEQAKLAKQQPFPLWDFSGYNYYSTSHAPLSKNTSFYSPWFWETVHYKQDLGDLVLNQIFKLSPSHYPFGVQLTTANLTEHETQITQDHKDYQATHSNEITIIQQLIANTSQTVNK